MDRFIKEIMVDNLIDNLIIHVINNYVIEKKDYVIKGKEVVKGDLKGSNYNL